MTASVFLHGHKSAGRQAFHLLRLPGLYAIIVRGVVTAYFWGDISYACVKRGVIQNETGVNWRKIKAEYIAGGISQRALSEKYGVPFGTLQKQDSRIQQSALPSMLMCRWILLYTTPYRSTHI